MSKTETGFQFRFDGFVPVDFSKPEQVAKASEMFDQVRGQLATGGADVTADVKPANRRSESKAKP